MDLLYALERVHVAPLFLCIAWCIARTQQENKFFVITVIWKRLTCQFLFHHVLYIERSRHSVSLCKYHRYSVHLVNNWLACKKVSDRLVPLVHRNRCYLVCTRPFEGGVSTGHLHRILDHLTLVHAWGFNIVQWWQWCWW